jgi:hypothetical protein
MMNETLFSLLALSLSFNNTLANQGDHSIVADCGRFLGGIEIEGEW